MRYYVVLIFLLSTFFVACSPSSEESAADQTPVSEIQAEESEHDEAEHDEEHEDEHDEHAEHEEGDEHREHGAHEHGAAVLTIAWSGNEIAMDLETPAFNILGFEHAPSTTAEQDLLDESLQILQEGNLFQFLAAEAECVVIDAAVTTSIGEGEQEHDEEMEHDEHEDEEGETHSDIDVSYNIECQNPEQIEMLDATQLFTQFSNFEELRVQWLSDTQQSAKDLTADDPILTLE